VGKRKSRTWGCSKGFCQEKDGPPTMGRKRQRGTLPPKERGEPKLSKKRKKRGESIKDCGAFPSGQVNLMKIGSGFGKIAAKRGGGKKICCFSKEPPQESLARISTIVEKKEVGEGWGIADQIIN